MVADRTPSAPIDRVERFNALKAQLASFPDELKEKRRWVTWKHEVRNGKSTKVPYDPGGGWRASTTDPKTWGTFDDACKAVACDPSYAGVGFVLGDGIIGFDGDGAYNPDTGEIAPEMRQWLDLFSTYTEVSPSGKGLHAFAHGEVPEGARRGSLELYPGGRFFTVTGDRLADYPAELAHINGVAADLYNALKGGQDQGRPAPTSGRSPLSDDGVLRLAMGARNGAKFSALWSGDTSGYDGDDSRADLALCSILAFWCGRDGDQIDRLFRQSGLMRDKWDERRARSTYGQRTIAEAVYATDEVYTPRHLLTVQVGKRPRVAVAATDEVLNEDEHCGTDERADRSPANEAARGYDYQPCTDMGNAKRMVRLAFGYLVFSEARGWMAYDGQRWEPDETGEAMRWAKLLPKDLMQEADDLIEEATRAEEADDKDKASKFKAEAKRLVEWAFKTHSRNRLEAALALAKTERDLVVRPADFDVKAWVLNTPAATLDLQTGEIRAHAPADMLTRITRARHNLSATCPIFQQVLQRAQPSREVRAYIQRLAGYWLTGSTREQKVFFWVGEGSNSKSTIANALLYAIGDYGGIARPESFLTKKHADGIPNDLAALVGRRLVLTAESEDGQHLAESLVKRITGGDALTVRFLNREFFTYTPTWKLLFVTNHAPKITGTDRAIWRRIEMLPWREIISDAERDRTLPEQLQAEAGGILAWAIRGCAEYLAQGLNPPEVVQLATDAYRSASATVERFVASRCVCEAGAAIPKGDIYAAYCEWCDEMGTENLSAHKFRGALVEMGMQEARRTDARIWAGIKLRDTMV